MGLVWLIALVALLQYTFFSFMVGKARGTYGIQAPAVTGHEEFERYYRVQMNTVELLVSFLPALGISAMAVSPWFATAMGVVYVIGRQLFYFSYVKDPKSRGLGFSLSFFPIVAMIIGSIIYIVKDYSLLK